MFTAQVVLIIAAVGFVAVAIAGSGQFVQIKIPELKTWSRWALGIAGAGLFASAFLIPSVAGQSPNQPSAASSPSAPAGPSSPASAARPPSGPIVQVKSPQKGQAVPQGKGFVATGTVRQLGNDTIWLTDYDGGYTVDNQASVDQNGTWTASDSDLGNAGQPLPFVLTARVILADAQCAAKLQAAENSNSDYLTSLPGGCTVAGHIAVQVTTR